MFEGEQAKIVSFAQWFIWYATCARIDVLPDPGTPDINDRGYSKQDQTTISYSRLRGGNEGIVILLIGLDWR